MTGSSERGFAMTRLEPKLHARRNTIFSRQTVSRSPAIGRAGAVAAARRASVEAALYMLERGGNAVDAAIAAAFVAGVIEPMETTLAGSGFMLVSEPQGAVHAIEFPPRAPSAASSTMFEIDTSRALDRGLGVSVVVGDKNVAGATAVGVPTTIAGLLTAQEHFGRLERAIVMAPAIRAAYDGFEIDSYFALEALANVEALRADPGASSLYLHRGLPPVPPHLGGTTLGVASLLKQPQLGRTLELVSSQGRRGFYEGETATALVETVRSGGGVLSTQDLAACHPLVGRARRLVFRDCEVWTPRSPSGALTQLQILNIWQELHPAEPPMEDSPERLRGLAEASWHAFADRYHWLGDPDVVPVPEAGLLSPDYARSIARAIRDREPPPRALPEQGLPWEYFASVAAHDPWAFQDRSKRPSWRPMGATEAAAGTTHVSVLDGNGLAVSITHTAANHFGAKAVCPRTGLLLDAAMGWFNARVGAANSIAPWKRPLANMGPMIITRDGRALAALGAPGGRRIIHAVVQVLLNIVERGMGAQDAVDAPRLDASGSTLLASERLADVAAALREAGVPVALVADEHEPFGYELGRPVVAMRDHDGRSSAAIDSLTRGTTAAL